MITVYVKKDQNHIKNVRISGHANYEEYGKDIVCAATSSIITTTINGILSIQSDVLEVMDDGNLLEIKVLYEETISQKLLLNMITLLKDLETQYQKNIKVKGE